MLFSFSFRQSDKEPPQANGGEPTVARMVETRLKATFMGNCLYQILQALCFPSVHSWVVHLHYPLQVASADYEVCLHPLHLAEHLLVVKPTVCHIAHLVLGGRKEGTSSDNGALHFSVLA